ncbi:hypothetical protein [Glaciihabitans sp. UYNi722]|uniref:hypothetical protein n=1 Tax=Glaciihabitans sp. UYNi722 TaxID=3156344 RepID=UPI00339614AB
MFLRNGHRQDSGKDLSAFGLVITGVALIAVGALLLGLGAIGVLLVGRAAFAAVLLPLAGIALVVAGIVAYARRDTSRPPSDPDKR